MTETTKGKSPFYPGQPVPVELFTGRPHQIERIMTRGVGQVAAGKPIAIYVQGEYGIGKSSIAGFVQWLAEKEHGLHGIYAPLGGVSTLTDVASAILEATARSGALHPSRSEKVLNWLAKYVGKQELLGVTFNAEALRKDALTLSSAFSMLEFLRQVIDRLADSGVKGIFLVLDEIDAIADNPDFAHLVKGLVDTNALAKSPVPLLLMLCGVEECRRGMIRNHEPIDRIFDVVEIEPMSTAEMEVFFIRAFDSAGMTIEPEAMQVLIHYSAGFPKIMHLLGDAAYWLDEDNTLSQGDALQAAVVAADEVGKKYVDQQVYKALRSEDYRSILKKITKVSPAEMSFKRSDVAAGLTEGEKKKLDNFLRRMKVLKVIRSGDTSGEYVFNLRMVRLYIWMQSQ